MNVLWLFLAVAAGIWSAFLFLVFVMWVDQADKTARPSEVKAKVRG